MMTMANSSKKQDVKQKQDSTYLTGPLAHGMWPWVLQDKNTSITLQIAMAAFDAGVPVMLVSNPGMGKTESIKALCATLGWEMQYLSMASMSFDDVSGNPRAVPYTGKAPHEDNDMKTEYAAPDWQWSLLEQEATGQKKLLTLDEFNTASRSTQKTFLPIIQSKIFPSGKQFSKDTPILGAMNPADKSDGFDLSMAMKNRICWLRWEPKDTSEGFLNRWQSPVRMSLPIVKSKQSWEEELEREKKLASIAIKYRDNTMGGDFNALNTDKDDPQSSDVRAGDEVGEFIFDQAQSSQRSWDNMISIIARIPQEALSPQLVDAVVYGTIGRKYGQAFSRILYTTLNEKGSIGLDYDHVAQDPYSVDWTQVSVTDAAEIWAGINGGWVSGDQNKQNTALNVLFAIHDGNEALDDSALIRAIAIDTKGWLGLGPTRKATHNAFTARFQNIIDSQK